MNWTKVDEVLADYDLTVERWEEMLKEPNAKIEMSLLKNMVKTVFERKPMRKRADLLEFLLQNWTFAFDGPDASSSDDDLTELPYFTTRKKEETTEPKGRTKEEILEELVESIVEDRARERTRLARIAKIEEHIEQNRKEKERKEKERKEKERKEKERKEKERKDKNELEQKKYTTLADVDDLFLELVYQPLEDEPASYNKKWIMNEGKQLANIWGWGVSHSEQIGTINYETETETPSLMQMQHFLTDPVFRNLKLQHWNSGDLKTNRGRMDASDRHHILSNNYLPGMQEHLRKYLNEKYSKSRTVRDKFNLVLQNIDGKSLSAKMFAIRALIRSIMFLADTRLKPRRALKAYTANNDYWPQLCARIEEEENKNKNY